MNVLVANLGSTSFKYKLFDMPSESVLAVGGADRIGQGRSAWTIRAGGSGREGTEDLGDHAAAIELHLGHLTDLGAIAGIDEIQAIGFKAVHGGPLRGAVRVDENVLDVMEQFAAVAPQHNPPYIAAMRAFGKRLPDVPQVAAFETGFHQTIPLSRQVYGVPHDWVERLGVRRYGFHGASHCWVATRLAELAPGSSRIISCHLGGSCSICALRDGQSRANSFGMTAQSGVFHSSRVGDFDAFALLKLCSEGLELEEIWQTLGHASGLKGLSGISADMREVQEAADSGDPRANLGIEAFVESCRHYVGAYLAVLNGADAVVFTGGIGQFAPSIRERVCRDLDFAGIVLDRDRNLAVSGKEEARIETPGSAVQIWVVPTNEELIVARQTVEVLGGGRGDGRTGGLGDQRTGARGR